MAKHVPAERKASTIIRQTPKKSSQSNAFVERAHQSVEAMVRHHEEVIVIEDKAKIKLSATEDIATWMIRHAAFLQTRFSVGKDGTKHHSREDITKTIQVSFCHSDPLLMRKSETRRLNAVNLIPDSFQAFGMEEHTESDEHIVGTAQGCVHSKVSSCKE